MRQLGLADGDQLAFGGDGLHIPRADPARNGDTGKSLPCRTRPAVVSSTITEGNSGNSVGCGNQRFVQPAFRGQLVKLLHRARLFDREIARAHPPQRGKMRAAAHRFSQFVRDGSHVGSRRAAGPQAGFRAFQSRPGSARIHAPGPASAPPRSAVAPAGMPACLALSLPRPAAAATGIRRGMLRSFCSSISACKHRRHGAGCGRALAVIRIRRVAKTHPRIVDFVAAHEELSEPGCAPDHQRQHTCSHGIERAEMPDPAGIRRACAFGSPRRARSSLPAYRRR